MAITTKELEERSLFYKSFREYFPFVEEYCSWPIIGIYAFVMILFWGLSSVVFSKFVSFFVSWLMGTSIFFLLFAAAVLFRVTLAFIVADAMNVEPNNEVAMKQNKRREIIVLVVMLVLSLTAVITTNKYRHHYEFQCSTCYVDGHGYIHLYDNCEYMEGNGVRTLKGWEAERYYHKYCEACEVWAEEANDAYLVR